MAKPLRPMSENYTPACCPANESISYSSDAGLVDEDNAPIFSLSKSSMDVMAMGMPNKRDPAWTRLDLRRSSSTNTHSEQDAVTVHQLYPHVWQHANSHRTPISSQSVGLHNPPALSDRWISNMQRWSGCSSSSTHSRSSTPDTMVWKGSSSRASSLSHGSSFSGPPDSPLSKLNSPPTTPSPYISPHLTPTLPPVDLLGRSTFRRSIQKQEDLPEFSAAHSPSPSPLRTLPSSPFRIHSPHHRLSRTEDEGYLNNNMLSFQFPSPIPSSDNLLVVEESSIPRCLDNNERERLASPTELLGNKRVESPLQRISYTAADSPAAQQGSRGGQFVGALEVPEQQKQIFLTDQAKRPLLVSSISDSQLEFCCRCSQHQQDMTKTKVFREEATSTSHLDLVDVAVQTITPINSIWNIKRNISFSNIGSPSLLGSPPGSKLNLKSSIGSNSNLVSPSSSMFPVNSEEEDGGEEKQDPKWNVALQALPELERRRSCLKMHVDAKDEVGGRRSSMKQVQWDEDGMTWDIHGATLDPEELTTAIQKHLDLQNSQQQKRRSSKKKKAPEPPVRTNMLTAIISDRNMPLMIIAAEDDADTEQDGESKTKKLAPRRRSRAEADLVKDDEEDEVYGEEGFVKSKSLSQEGGQRKKGMKRSLRRPGWCGGSQQVDD